MIYLCLRLRDGGEVKKVLLASGNPKFDQFIRNNLKKYEYYDISQYSAEFLLPRILEENIDILIVGEELPSKTSLVDELKEIIIEKEDITIVVYSRKHKEKGDPFFNEMLNIGVARFIYGSNISISSVEKAIEDEIKASTYQYWRPEVYKVITNEGEKTYHTKLTSQSTEQAFEEVLKAKEAKEVTSKFEKISNALNTEEVKSLFTNLPINKQEIIINNVDNIDKATKEELTTIKNAVQEISKQDIKDAILKMSQEEKEELGLIDTVEKETFTPVIPKDYKKTILLLSPFSTGKTEIASNIAASLAKKGIKVALLDLDWQKFGVGYNFLIQSAEEYSKFKLLLRKIKDIDKKNTDDLPPEQLFQLAAYKEKDLYVFTGHHEIKCLIGEEDLGKPNTKETIISKEQLLLLIKYLKTATEVLVIDIGKSLPLEVVEALLDMDNIEKFMVTNQNIEVLNAQAYCRQFNRARDYKNWKLIVNQHSPSSSFSLKEIKGYFYDESTDYQRYEIQDIYTVPHMKTLWDLKAKRKVYIGKNSEFDEAIEHIINGCISIENKKGFFKKIFGRK